MQLKDKTIIITGASSGIGAAAAMLFAQEGANLVLGARRQPELTTLGDQITQSNGQAVALAGDVQQEDYNAALVGLAVEQFGSLNGAFNNAGTTGEMGPIPAMSTENWRTVLEVNLT